MTTITFNALNTTGRGFNRPATGHHAWDEGTVLARVLDVAGRAFIAAVPFAAIGWMFVAH
jgi:hypothetical protein